MSHRKLLVRLGVEKREIERLLLRVTQLLSIALFAELQLPDKSWSSSFILVYYNNILLLCESCS